MSFVNIIDSQLTRFLADKRGEMTEISPDLTPLLDYSSNLLTGGKRFRARFCYWGWRAAAGGSDAPEPADHHAYLLATALEVFHAAALCTTTSWTDQTPGADSPRPTAPSKNTTPHSGLPETRCTTANPPRS